MWRQGYVEARLCGGKVIWRQGYVECEGSLQVNVRPKGIEQLRYSLNSNRSQSHLNKGPKLNTYTPFIVFPCAQQEPRVVCEGTRASGTLQLYNSTTVQISESYSTGYKSHL